MMLHTEKCAILRLMKTSIFKTAVKKNPQHLQMGGFNMAYLTY